MEDLDWKDGITAFLRRNPLVGVATCIAAGIVATYASGGNWLVAAAFLATFAIFLIFKSRIGSLAALFGAIGAGAYLLAIPPTVDVDALNADHRWRTGVVEEVTERPSSTRLIVEMEPQGDGPRMKLRCQINTPQMLTAQPGDVVRFRGEYSSTDPRPDIPDERTYELYLAAKRVSVGCFVVPDSIEITGSKPGPLHSLARLRHGVADVIVDSDLSDGCSAFLCALLVGDTSLLADDTRDAFSSAGLAHVLALSGMHVGFIAVVVGILLFPLAMAGHGRTRWVITILVLWLYALLTGLSPSVVRAVVMTTAAAIGLLAQRDVYSVNSLALAAIIILIIWPMSIFMIGFQLSFIAVLGILAFGRRIGETAKGLPRWLRRLTDYAAISTAAVLGSGPLCAYHFHRFPLVFIFTNILIALLLPPFVALGLMLVAVGACGVELQWLCTVLDWLYTAISWIASVAADLPRANIEGIYFSAWLLIPIYLAIAALWAWMRTRKGAFGVAAAMLAAFAVGAETLGTPVYPPCEAYTIRSKYQTTLLAREGTTATYYTTAMESAHGYYEDLSRQRHADFFGKRGVDSIRVVTTHTRIPVTINGKRVIMATSEAEADSIMTRPDVLIVCHGYKGDIVGLSSRLRPGKTVLSCDLDPRRRNRYATELTAAGLPFDVIE